jgi:hypothetical protein
VWYVAFVKYKSEISSMNKRRKNREEEAKNKHNDSGSARDAFKS